MRPQIYSLKTLLTLLFGGRERSRHCSLRKHMQIKKHQQIKKTSFFHQFDGTHVENPHNVNANRKRAANPHNACTHSQCKKKLIYLFIYFHL